MGQDGFGNPTQIIIWPYAHNLMVRGFQTDHRIDQETPPPLADLTPRLTNHVPFGHTIDDESASARALKGPS